MTTSRAQTLPLPEPIAAYLAAEHAQDTVALRRCFAANAIVRDEGRERIGIDAIVAWSREAHARYRYAAQALSIDATEQPIHVRVRLTGTFPGSPVELGYAFTLADDQIVRLEIQ